MTRRARHHGGSAEGGFPIVGVGASAGGLETFVELLRALPRDTGMAFVLIQHLDPKHASYLSEVLARSTRLPVVEIREGVRVEPDHVYVIPAGSDVGILNGVLTLLPRATDVRGPALPIDFFFKALAADRGHQAIGVVLSGTGSDGVEGLRAIKAESGVSFAQEPRSAKFDGMPKAAVAAGVTDFVLPVPELARELERISRHPFLVARDGDGVLASPADDGELDKVLVLLRAAVGVDFSDYKRTSIRRRLARRMAVHRLTALHDYVQLLRDDRAEARALFDDILIHVTSFFRDPHVFAQLGEHVFPELVRERRAGGTIRIWCAGCSTGEEAYSLVIALLEFLDREHAPNIPIQLFASDVSPRAIEAARVGWYSDAAVRDLGSERVARYFTRVETGGYQIAKPIRERCAFVEHDLASDPPFSKLDLVSCRNVLIYFDAELQKRVLERFHFALNTPGFLLLGRAENPADAAGLFSLIDKDAKLFARKPGKSVLRLAPSTRGRFPAPSPEEPSRRGALLDRLLHQVETRLLDQYAPPGVIVNERLEILRFRGRTGPYLEPAPGEPRHDLLKMARPGLIADLRLAISEAKAAGTTVRRAGVRIDEHGASRDCDVIVIPVSSPRAGREPLFAVLFEEPRGAGGADELVGPPAPRAPRRGDDDKIAKLEAELEATHAYLQSIVDEHQRTNDELLTANQELVSGNEELQSMNEELETAKEELQSTNEELSTLNEELQARNAELDSVNGDLVNILGSVEVPIVIVDGQRRIRRFTPKARPILNLLPSDVGRPIDDIKPNLAIDDVDRKIAAVIDTVAPHEEEVRGRGGQWYRLQIRPYTTLDKRIDGAVISVVDIDVLKRALGAAEWARDYANATVEAIPMPLIVLDARHEVVSSNRAFREHFGRHEPGIERRSVYALLEGAWDRPELRAAIARVFDTDTRFEALELDLGLPGLGGRALSLSGRLLPTPDGERLALIAFEDLTDRRRSEAERERLLAEAEAAKAGAEHANRAKDQFLAVLSHELRTPLSTLLLQAQLLLQAKLDPARIRQAGAAIERAATAQAQLIDDLLDISRIVTGKLRMELRPLDLTALVRTSAEIIRPSTEAKHVELALAVDDVVIPVSGDPVRLRQVMWNLLTNAVKFTPDGGRVAVEIETAGGRARVRVRDSGVGIEPSFLPNVFDHFSQEDRTHKRSYGGLGLGLGIVRSVVEAHGGVVRADSEGKGRGSTFTVELPLLSSPAVVAGAGEVLRSPAAADGIAGARILVVEDDPGTREALADMLGLSGAVVHAAESAAEAMAVFDEFEPELVVSDIAMADEDGYSLLGRIRARGDERGGDVPALALTALAGDDDRRRSAAAGFQVHMAKPVNFERLVAALAGLRRGSAPS